MLGLLDGVGPCFLGAEIAQQWPNKSLRSNDCNAAVQKRLAKCEKSLFLRYIGEHWRILCPQGLTTNGGMFPGVDQVTKPLFCR